MSMFHTLCKNIFGIKNYYEGAKKYKIITVLGINFKFRVKYKKDVWSFVRNSVPCPIDNTVEPPREKVYLSVASIFKDEPDIIEWIEYHKIAGVERFYLYDNDSRDDYETILKPYIDSGLVCYKKIHGQAMQRAAYKDAVYRYKDETEWLAIIDLDEYIVPVEKDDIKDYLKDFDQYPAAVANWIMFDSNGVEKRTTDKTVIETYTRVHKDYQTEINRTVKSIVKPREVRFQNSAHTCIYKHNRLAKDENFNDFCGYVYFMTNKVSVNKIRINHYYCKSREDYSAKINRGFADQTRNRTYDESVLNFKDTTNDYVIMKYADRLKEQLKDVIHN